MSTATVITLGLGPESAASLIITIGLGGDHGIIVDGPGTGHLVAGAIYCDGFEVAEVSR